jgi:hypothetical protein
VAEVISTTNWTDLFITADEFAPVLAEPHPKRFRRRDPLQLTPEQRRLVGSGSIFATVGPSRRGKRGHGLLCAPSSSRHRNKPGA